MSGSSASAALRADIEALLAGPVGQRVRAAGGIVEIDAVDGETARLRMGGTARNCQSVIQSLLFQLERELRKLHPSLESLTTLELSGQNRPV